MSATSVTRTAGQPPADRPSAPDTPCPNCGAPVAETYCGRCGQERVAPLTWGGVARAAWEVVDVDAPLLRTLRDLTLRPGETCRDYLDGRRRRYVQPVKYVLLTATALLLVWHLSGADAASPGVSRERVDATRVFRTILGFWGYYLFVILLPVAALQAVLARRDRRPVVECYAFDLYVFGHAQWLSMASPVFGIGPQSLPGVAIQAAQLAFVIHAVHGFYRSGWVAAVGQGVLIFATFIAASIATGFVTYAVLSRLG